MTLGMQEIISLIISYTVLFSIFFLHIEINEPLLSMES